MLDTLLIHPATKKQLFDIISSPSQALLLHGVEGVGLDTIGEAVGATIAGRPSFVEHIWAEKTGISIEQIREFYVQTRSKSKTKQVIVLHDADRMSDAAQTAFLKLLEEPTPGTFFILLAHYSQRLLPTIHSRVQKTEILPLTDVQTERFISSLTHDKKIKQQINFIAAGMPAEIYRLVTNDKYREDMFALATAAKQLVSGSLKDRLMVVNAHSSDRVQVEKLLDIVSRILLFQINQSPANTGMLQKLNKVLLIQQKIVSNGNIKAQLLRFTLN